VEHSVRKQVLQEKSLAVAPKLLEKLSPPMQRELSYQLLSSILTQFPVYAACPSTFISQLAQAHTWMLALTGDLVVEEGQLVEEMVFLVNGVLLQLNVPGEGVGEEEEGSEEGYEDPQADVKETVMRAGTWWGERCLFTNPEPREFTVLADTDSELAVLPAQEYYRICQMYPNLWRKHRALCKHIENGTMNMRDLVYRPPRKSSRRSSWQYLPGFLKEVL